MFRCKFKVEEVTRFENSRRLKLVATNKVDGDNKDWSKWTPSGHLEISVTNVDAFPRIDSLSVGDCYWIDINPVI